MSETTVKKKSKIQNGQGKSICEREASNKKFHTHRDPKTLEKKKECISPFFLCSHVPMTYFPSIGKKKKNSAAPTVPWGHIGAVAGGLAD